MPEDMSEKDVKRYEYVRQECQKICQKRLSKNMSEEMSIAMSEKICKKRTSETVSQRMSEDMSEKGVRKNVRQKCQKIRIPEKKSVDMSELMKICQKNVRSGAA